MKIPSSLNIKGADWKIVLKERLFDEGDEIRGLCDFEEKTIYISVQGHKTTKSMHATFLHELFHAVLFENALDQTDLDRNLHEIIVESLSRFMLDTFSLSLKKR
jgi:hypothetical protein